MPNLIDYIILGNGVSAITAAEEIRSHDHAGSIKMFTDEKYPFYARIRLPHFLAGEVALEKLILKKETWYQDNNIDLHLNEPAIDASLNDKTITTKNGVYSFKKLLLATGSHSFRPQMKGVEHEGVFTLRNIDDVLKIKGFIKGKKRAVIIGGGLLGLEAGRALMSSGLDVSVAVRSGMLLQRQVDAAGANILKCIMEKHGYKFLFDACTEEIKGEGDHLRIVFTNGIGISCDLILLTAGVRPNMEIAKKLDLKAGKGIVVDEYMRTSAKDVFAAGDVIEYANTTYGIWPAAKDQGKIAGANMVKMEARYEGTVMTTTLKVAGINLTSIGDFDAENNKQSIVKVSEKDGIYKKYVIHDDALIGCILLGDNKEQRKMEKAIREKRNFNDLKESQSAWS
jgi:nitrite reductase (NADH) large subunit